MSDIPTLTIGDTYDEDATLYHKGGVYDCSGATAIKAVIGNDKSTVPWSAEVTLDSNAVGANWANGVVVYNFTHTITAAISSFVKPEDFNKNGLLAASIETQVEINGGRYTWTAPINLRMGMIA